MGVRQGSRSSALTAIFFATAFSFVLTVGAQDGPTSVDRDPIKILNGPNRFVGAQFAMPVAPDNMLRGGPASQSPPVSAWVTGDPWGEDAGRNYLEAGVSTEFLLRKNARYPLTITIPTSIAFGQEEWFLGPSFGYITTGMTVRVPVSFVHGRRSRWTAGGSLDVCYYGQTAAEFIRSAGFPARKIGGMLSVEF